MKRFYIDSEFTGLRSWILNLPETFNEMGTVMKDNRNILRKTKEAGQEIVVKDFKGMYFLNRLAYSLFAKSKAEKSFNHSAILNERGIATPQHIAWVNCYRWGILTRCYFISIFSPAQTFIETINELKDSAPHLKEKLLRDFAGFAKKLHKSEIYHKDFSNGNVLVTKADDRFEFSLVDLNRIKFFPVNYVQGLKNFATLGLTQEDLYTIIEEYALLRNEDVSSSIKILEEYRQRKSYRRSIRKKLRKLTITRIENLMRSNS
ncbi:lipopolysaccharide kinase InaA family protein [Chryseosolibacter indicus]|uniref:Protein kinase domain-containing protein n=1 Tax=Chryseosolibacter indicus TaxID=2782351 RepID=A0ABS5VPF6_9BACT|nr:lipopolysaccharide kinase InaA family protein [Chryseosolibacter indicus]MBT1701896.1 hypothetical protein [Chryseosolibacter indicus]